MKQFREQLDYSDTILDGAFRLVQTRLKDGAVYVNHDQTQYLRIGDTEQSVAEEIQTRSLEHKGFPVAHVIRHGELQGKWYFVEQSLGNQHFGMQFNADYQRYGSIQEVTFDSFLMLMTQYAEASFGALNRHRKGELARDICFYNETKSQYPIDSSLFESVMQRIEDRLKTAPVGTINTDLGPFNIMDGGVIDLEFIHVGPLGYDLVTAPVIGYIFPDTLGYRHRIAYRFSADQLTKYYKMLNDISVRNNLEPVTKYMNEFIVMKVIWAAARPNRYEHRAFEDLERERFWSEFRFNVLRHTLNVYMKGEDIAFTDFPEIGVNKSI